jgi:hypothetical protein
MFQGQREDRQNSEGFTISQEPFIQANTLQRNGEILFHDEMRLSVTPR